MPGKHYKSGFKMKGWSAFTKKTGDMADIKVTPSMEAERNEYNALNKKLQEKGFLEDNEAKRYDNLSKKRNLKKLNQESYYGEEGYEARD